MTIRNVPAILCSATIISCVVVGCASKGPYLSDAAEIPPQPTTQPESAAIVVESPVIPLPRPATAPAAFRTSAPTATRPIAPIPTPAPAPPPAPALMTRPVATTVPATSPTTQAATPTATPAGELAANFNHELADLSRGQPASEPGALAGLSTQEQRTLSAILQGIAQFRDKLKTQSIGQAATAMLDMADRIRSVAPLQIPSMALCNKVDGFGLYDTIDARFPANREFSLVIYCELSGFSSRTGDRAMWETRLSQEISVVDGEGNVRWHDHPSTVVDACRNRRRDFYVARVIRLPANLPAGKYVLQTQITDQFTKELAQSGAEIELIAEPR